MTNALFWIGYLSILVLLGLWMARSTDNTRRWRAIVIFTIIFAWGTILVLRVA